ncbi:GNAT family N-acetyltransferase [Caballeronia calidae]|nr:GNAT family N-acetyltransferase [Caballeronia calidae]
MSFPTHTLIENCVAYQLRQATEGDFAFAEALTRGNMAFYLRTHNIDWHSHLFIEHWLASENFVLHRDNTPIGIMLLSEEPDSLHICEVQIVHGYRGRGAGTCLLNTAHLLAAKRGLTQCRLWVFADNPAARLYARLGYKPVEPVAGQSAALQQMIRRV